MDVEEDILHLLWIIGISQGLWLGGSTTTRIGVNLTSYHLVIIMKVVNTNHVVKFNQLHNARKNVFLNIHQITRMTDGEHQMFTCCHQKCKRFKQKLWQMVQFKQCLQFILIFWPIRKEYMSIPMDLRLDCMRLKLLGGESRTRNHIGLLLIHGMKIGEIRASSKS